MSDTSLKTTCPTCGSTWEIDDIECGECHAPLVAVPPGRRPARIVRTWSPSFADTIAQILLGSFGMLVLSAIPATLITSGLSLLIVVIGAVVGLVLGALIVWSAWVWNSTDSQSIRNLRFAQRTSLFATLAGIVYPAILLFRPPVSNDTVGMGPSLLILSGLVLFSPWALTTWRLIRWLVLTADGGPAQQAEFSEDEAG